jgi:hypothetical protein
MSTKMRRLKFIGGQNRYDVKVLDAETGQDLSDLLHITKFTIRFDARDRYPTAEIELTDFDYELEADVEMETTRAYKRLERDR